MVAVTFPDGARRDYPQNTTGLDIAKGISPSLAKRTVAMALDGKLADLADPIPHDAKIEFLTRDDPRALELIRHDAAHVLAEAVQTLWPGTQGHGGEAKTVGENPGKPETADTSGCIRFTPRLPTAPLDRRFP